MPTMEQHSVEAARGLVEPGQISARFLGRRKVDTNVWQPQDPWLSLVLAPPQSEKQEEGTMVLSTSEVSMERISLAPGTAVIELTDDEAQQIIDSYGEDAFPPQ